MIEEFISEFAAKAPMYETWAGFVASEIFRSIPLDQPLKEQLLKIPVQSRLKKASSIRAKVARYNITSPRNEIKDLVGIRFVVLLTSDIALFEGAIENNPNWTAEKSRDFADQARTQPELFDYQSVHYAVTSVSQIEIGSQIVESGLICEVQIRTLLQHAYAELTHDNIYKPVQLVPSSAKRYVARSMALMETTDDLFCRTLQELRIANQPRNDLYAELISLFRRLITTDTSGVDERINLEILEIFNDRYDYRVAANLIECFWAEHPTLIDSVRSHSNHFLFTQPGILFLYWLVSTDDFLVKTRWPYGSMIEELRFIYSDLGFALGDQC